MSRQCGFHASCEQPGVYGLVDFESQEPIAASTKPLCLHHVTLHLADLEPGESRVVFKGDDPAGVLQAVTC